MSNILDMLENEELAKEDPANRTEDIVDGKILLPAYEEWQVATEHCRVIYYDLVSPWKRATYGIDRTAFRKKFRATLITMNENGRERVSNCGKYETPEEAVTALQNTTQMVFC